MDDGQVITDETVFSEIGDEDETPQVTFSGRVFPLLWLVLKNSLFTILTLGIYRFWAKTWIRRYFWNNVSIAGEPLEYTGQPKELFLGFLIVLAVLAPLGIVDSFSTTLLAGYPDLRMPYTVTFYCGLFLLIKFAYYRMWRYRMTRTAWRGIHFSLSGSASRFVLRSLIWTIVTILTLGLASPWGRTALARYRINNSQFGNRSFTFHGSGKGLLIPWLVAYLVPIAIVLFWTISNGEKFGIWLQAIQYWMANDMYGNPPYIGNPKMIGLLWLAGVSFPILLVWYKTWEFRYFINSTRFGTVTLTSGLSTLMVLGLFTTTYVLIMVLIVGSVVIMVLPTVMILQPGIDNDVIGFATVGIMIVLFFFIGPLLMDGFLRYQLVKRFCRSLSISDMAALENVAQTTRAAPKRGEGFADALDVGAF